MSDQILKTHVKCPICGKKVPIVQINSHLDSDECVAEEAEDLFPKVDDDIFLEEVEEDSFISRFKRSPTTRGSLSSDSSPQKSPVKKRSKLSSEDEKKVKPYYLANWETILRGVLEECSDDASLFTQEELLLATRDFQALSPNAQKLYVRLFQRKWTWIAQSKITYSEIDDTSSALKELLNRDFLSDHSKLHDLPTIFHLLPSQELKKLCKSFNVDKTSKKDIIVAFDKMIHQKSFFNKSGVNEVLKAKVLKKALSSLNPCYILTEKPRRLFNRILSLHSLTRFYEDRDNNNAGNSNMTMMLLTHRGDVSFPIYEIQRTCPIFRSREGLLAFETALEFESTISELFEGKEYKKICDELYPKLFDHYKTSILGNFSAQDANIPDFLRKFTAGGIIVYCLSKCAEAFEKIRDYKSAVSVYEYCLSKDQIYNKELYSGHWYERLSLDLEQWLKKRQKAYETILGALENPHISPARKLTLCQRIKKMRKHLKDEEKSEVKGWIDPDDCEKSLRNVEIQGVMLDKDLSGSRSNQKTIFIFSKGENNKLYCSVEEFTIQYYKEEFPKGLHGEGSVINSIVFLLFWDVVYDSLVPDAFRGPYQASPLDLGSFHFYESRSKDILTRLDMILDASNDALGDLLEGNWKAGVGTSSLVAWDLFSEFDVFKGLVDCFTREQLVKISRRLLKRHRFYRSGFPDLTLWNPSSKTLRFVEVKGPGDRLSTKQILWLNFLNEIGIDAVACYIQPVGSKSLN